MENNAIKEILIDDLVQISSTNFNDNIISKLKEKPVSKFNPIFKSSDLIIATIVSLLLFLIVEYKIINSLSKTTLLLSAILSFIPVFFIVFNKIHQLTINQKTK